MGGLGKTSCGKGILMLNSSLCPLAEASGMGSGKATIKKNSPGAPARGREVRAELLPTSCPRTEGAEPLRRLWEMGGSP